MRTLLTAFFLLSTSIPLIADISKEDVRKLIEARVSDQMLIEYIRKNGPVEPLSTQDLVDLKNVGAGDDVLRALVENSRTADAVTPPTTPDPIYLESPSYSYYYVPYYVPYTVYPSFFFYRPYFYYRHPYGVRPYVRTYPYSQGYIAPPHWSRPLYNSPGGVRPYLPQPQNQPPHRPPPAPHSNTPRGSLGSGQPHR